MRYVAIVAVSGLAVSAFGQVDHVHLTVDTESGQAGDQIKVETGWFQGEENISIGQDGYLYDGAEILIVEIGDTYAGGDSWDGRRFGSGPRLTSDFFFPTGRLDGGDFWFELTDVVPVSGNGTTEFGWAENHDGTRMNTAESAGATRDERSFWVGTNRHMHHQIVSSTMEGMWDVTLVGYDLNGRYTDADPVTMRFSVVPAPAGLALLGAGGLVAVRRRR